MALFKIQFWKYKNCEHDLNKFIKMNKDYDNLDLLTLSYVIHQSIIIILMIIIYLNLIWTLFIQMNFLIKSVY